MRDVVDRVTANFGDGGVALRVNSCGSAGSLVNRGNIEKVLRDLRIWRRRSRMDATCLVAAEHDLTTCTVREGAGTWCSARGRVVSSHNGAGIAGTAACECDRAASVSVL